MAKNSQYVPDSQILANQAKAAKMGITIPGLAKNGGGSGTTPTTNGSDSEAFSAAVQKRLLGQSNIVSSFDTQLEQSYTDAMRGVQTGADKTNQRIESVYSRERSGIMEDGQNAVGNFAESRNGFATQMAGLRAVVQTTDKNLNDLMQRKEELILQNDSAAAKQVSDLIIDRLKYKQQAEQQVFNNLLGMGNLSNSMTQTAQAASQFKERLNYDESSAMSEIALNYGLQTNPGETLTSLYSRASKDMGANSPAALAIKTAQSNIMRNNAEIARIQADAAKSGKGEKAWSEADMTVIAAAIAANPAMAGGLLGGVDDATIQAKILALAGDKSAGNTINNFISQGLSKDGAKQQILDDRTLSPGEKASLLGKVDGLYGNSPVTVSPSQGLNVYSAADWFSKNILGESSNLGSTASKNKRIGELERKWSTTKSLTREEMAELNSLRAK